MNSIETWIDALAVRWQIDDGKEGTVRSFKMATVNEYPAAITPEMVPCAVTYPNDVQVEYSEGGPTVLIWYGQTDFHLTKDVKTGNIPYILPFFGRIVTAAAGQMKLGGLVEYFSINQAERGAMQFVTYKKPDNTDDHQGILVRWIVKQNVSGQVTVAQ